MCIQRKVSKANLPFHQSCLFIDFSVMSSQTPLSVTVWYGNVGKEENFSFTLTGPPAGTINKIDTRQFNGKKSSKIWDHVHMGAAAAAKLLQSCLTLCDPIDGSPPGSPVPGILQARTPEWAAISFSSAWKWKVKVKSLSQVRPSATPWTAAFQAPPFMGFSRQEYWSGVPLLLLYWLCQSLWLCGSQ